MMHIQIRRTYLPRFVIALGLVLAALTLWNVVQMALLVVRARREHLHATVSAAPPILPSVPVRPSDVDLILRSGLFGKSNGSTPRTSLPFTLKGTYAGPHGQGFAIITDSHGRSAVYTNDGILPGNVRIAAIDAHQVLLDTPNGEESLPLHEPTGIPSFRQSATAQPDLGQAEHRRRPPPNARIPTRLPTMLMHAWRLRPGDNVITLNGKHLAGRLDLMRHLHQIQPGTLLHIRVIRDGRPITLDVRAPAPGILDRS